MGVAFAVTTSLALSALYESVQVLEDPFVAVLTLDGIDVYEELAVLYYQQLVETRRTIFPNAPEFKHNVKDTEADESDESLEDKEVTHHAGNRRMLLSDLGTIISKTLLMFSFNDTRTEDRRRSLQTMDRTSIFAADLPELLSRSTRF